MIQSKHALLNIIGYISLSGECGQKLYVSNILCPPRQALHASTQEQILGCCHLLFLHCHHVYLALSFLCFSSSTNINATGIENSHKFGIMMCPPTCKIVQTCKLCYFCYRFLSGLLCNLKVA